MSTDYTLNWTDDSLKPPFILPGGSVDSTSSSLALTAKGFVNWGERLQENLLKLLENFASRGVPPPNPTIGQLWFNDNEKEMFVFHSDTWFPLIGYQDVPPVVLQIINGTVTIDCKYEFFQLTLTSNVTNVVFKNVTTTKVVVIDIIQGASGHRTIAWPSSVRTVVPTTYVPSNVSGTVDCVGLKTLDAGNIWRLVYNKGQ